MRSHIKQLLVHWSSKVTFSGVYIKDLNFLSSCLTNSVVHEFWAFQFNIEVTACILPSAAFDTLEYSREQEQGENYPNQSMIRQYSSCRLLLRRWTFTVSTSPFIHIFPPALHHCPFLLSADSRVGFYRNLGSNIL